MKHSDILSLLETINKLEQDELRTALRKYPNETYTWWDYDNDEWLTDYPIISVIHYNMGAVDVRIRSVSLDKDSGRIEFDAVTNDYNVSIDFPAGDIVAGGICLIVDYLE